MCPDTHGEMSGRTRPSASMSSKKRRSKFLGQLQRVNLFQAGPFFNLIFALVRVVRQVPDVGDILNISTL